MRPAAVGLPKPPPPPPPPPPREFLGFCCRPNPGDPGGTVGDDGKEGEFAEPAQGLPGLFSAPEGERDLGVRLPADCALLGVVRLARGVNCPFPPVAILVFEADGEGGPLSCSIEGGAAGPGAGGGGIAPKGRMDRGGGCMKCGGYPDG